MAFTKLNAADPQAYYRSLLKSNLDDFCRFYWKDEDAYEKFGAFIIANKRGDLKFHSGPSITNSYSEPQFGSYGDLLGVNYSTYSISFTIGLYYITEDDWRRFLNWMSPTSVSWLRLGYESKWMYQCKINKIAEGSRYILKKTDTDTYYYAETTITFDLVGEPVAYSVAEYKFTESTSNHYCLSENDQNVKIVSDLDYPLSIDTTINLSQLFEKATENGIKDTNSFTLKCTTTTGEAEEQEEKILFTVSLSNLSWTMSGVYLNLHIKYLSDSGLLLYHFGDDTTKLLSLQESVSTGERIVNYMKVNKMLWPGRFNSAGLTPVNYEIVFSITTENKSDYQLSKVGSVNITGHGLTNVI